MYSECEMPAAEIAQLEDEPAEAVRNAHLSRQ